MLSAPAQFHALPPLSADVVNPSRSFILTPVRDTIRYDATFGQQASEMKRAADAYPSCKNGRRQIRTTQRHRSPEPGARSRQRHRETSSSCLACNLSSERPNAEATVSRRHAANDSPWFRPGDETSLRIIQGLDTRNVTNAMNFPCPWSYLLL